jgi:cysteine-rich repeat protein
MRLFCGVASLLLGGCASNPDLAWLHHAPMLSITPDGLLTSSVKQPSTVQVTVRDQDDPPDLLVVTARLGEVDLAELQGPLALDEDGVLTLTLSGPAGRQPLAITVVDPGGLSDDWLGTVAVLPNLAPTLWHRGDHGSSQAAGSHTFELEVRDADDPTTSLRVDVSTATMTLTDLMPDDQGRVLATVSLSTADEQLNATVRDPHGGTGELTLDLHVPHDPVAPLCALVSPTDGELFDRSASLPLLATGQHPFWPPGALAVTIASNRDGVLRRGVLDGRGELGAQIHDLSPGSHTLTASLEAPDHSWCTASTSITVSDRPEVHLLSPSAGAQVSAGTVHVLVELQDPDDDPATLTLVLRSDRDGELSTTTGRSEASLSIPVQLSQGAHVLTARVTDPHGLFAETTRAVTAGAGASCGNGVLEAGEYCDDGNQNDDDSCTRLCRPPSCGDGLVQSQEGCDPAGGSLPTCASRGLDDGTTTCTSQCTVDDRGCCSYQASADSPPQGTWTPDFTAVLFADCDDNPAKGSALRGRIESVSDTEGTATLSFMAATGLGTPATARRYWIVESTSTPTCDAIAALPVRLEGTWPAGQSVLTVPDVPIWTEAAPLTDPAAPAQVGLLLVVAGVVVTDQRLFQPQPLLFERSCR